MNKIKIIIISVFLIIFTISFTTTVFASTNSYIKISNIEANLNHQAIKFNIENDINSSNAKFGILLSKYDEELTIENNNIFNYKCDFINSKNFSISIKIPEYAFYQNIYAVAYAIIDDEVIYSNKVSSLYARLANLDKVIIKEINFNNNSLIFTMASSIDLNAEYGLLFSKNELINELSLENAKYAHFETEIVKLDALNDNNEFQVTIKDIPLYELNTTFKVAAYVKYNNTLETYYTKTQDVNILKLFNDKIINNLDISYNDSVDGIKFITNTNLINNNFQLGFIFINKEVTNLTIDSLNIYKTECNFNKFTVTMKNIPFNKLDEKISVVAYIKFINENNKEDYYYSDIYITSYNEVKETYLTNNS